MLRSSKAFSERPEKRDGPSDVVGRRPWFRAWASLFPAGSQNQFREDPSPTTCHGWFRHQIAACESRQLVSSQFFPINVTRVPSCQVWQRNMPCINVKIMCIYLFTCVYICLHMYIYIFFLFTYVLTCMVANLHKSFCSFHICKYIHIYIYVFALSWWPPKSIAPTTLIHYYGHKGFGFGRCDLHSVSMSQMARCRVFRWLQVFFLIEMFNGVFPDR